MRVAIVIHSLVGGGSERVAAELAGLLAESGCAANLISLDRPRAGEHPLDLNVPRRDLDVLGESRGLWAAVRANRHRVAVLSAALRELNPDVVVSLTDKTNVLAILATGRVGVPVVVSERIDPRHHPIGLSWEMLRRWTYRQAAAIVVQTQAVAEWARRVAPRVPVHVIPNAVRRPPRWVSERRRARPPGQRVVAIGRLERQKGFDLLLQAFGAVRKVHPAAELRIVGEGSERRRLEHLTDRLGLARHVQYAGWVPDVWDVLADADVFVLSSRYEGFPNALLEAMACGVACVAFDCPSGPGEIIRQQVDGLLVPAGAAQELATAVARLLADESLRRRLGAAAESVIERFDRQSYLRRWLQVLHAVTRRSPTAR